MSEVGSERLDILTEKRNAKISDYMHKSSRKIISFCIEYDIHTIIIGKNSEWKQNSKLSKKVNQHFVQIPFARFIEMIQYKAEGNFPPGFSIFANFGAVRLWLGYQMH